MSKEQDKSTQTQEPTEKKIRDARKKGDVPSSRETGNLMVIVSLLGIVIFVLPWQTSQLARPLSDMVEMAARIPVGTGQPGLVKVGQVTREFIYSLSVALAPLVMVMLGGAIFGVLIKGETAVSAERIRPKLSKLSPLEGMKRLFSVDALVEFLKGLIKVLVVGVLALWIANKMVRGIWQAPGFVPESLPGYLTDASARLLIAVTAFLLPLTIVDILWQRFSWRRKQMMSMKEIRDEVKESEGSPEIKARRAALRRQRSRQRIAISVPTASVVLTNPTHVAIALKYDSNSDPAPICVAKGADKLARRIREIAYENDVPIIENKPLARALFDVVEVDGLVPLEHWRVVAEIIGFVIDLQRNRHRIPPTGSTVRTTPE